MLALSFLVVVVAACRCVVADVGVGVVRDCCGSCGSCLSRLYCVI